jgi:hypothetical protein
MLQNAGFTVEKILDNDPSYNCRNIRN